ncbi:cytochrome P450 [Altererythrobacter aerius]|uniref:Cytochrome P450 n=1 Tax=Tsuneonella aeria TaxID=1837929 RepID=A0A6I4TC45_9SPHN|nr:cytochrome P450 [Tsuneonella aeria]MXO74334.1 cytochrome P450 [Tsuneonella aeria]
MPKPCAINVWDPAVYADEGEITARYRALRAAGPVHWVEAEPYRPFWALTRHADILEVERDQKTWLSAPRVTLVPAEVEQATLAQFGTRWGPVRTLIDMDEPDHRTYRAIAQAWFTPRSLRALEDRMDALASSYVDKLASLGGSCDFAEEIATPYPLTMITALLGLPESDNELVLKLTQELFHATDPERQRSGEPTGLATAQQFAFYLGGILQQRRDAPTDDLMSVIANSEIDGAPIPVMDAIAYGILLATAGHDTTSSSVGVGMLAFARNADQLERLKSDPDGLAATATDEIFRWATPVRHMMRTAAHDTAIAGQPIAAGESVCMLYMSANRDEDAFDAPYEFRIDRSPNRHLGFGYGAHHCLGRVLAEMEVKALFRELGRRVESVELAGEPDWVRTNFTGGLKRLPLRYTMRGGA